MKENTRPDRTTLLTEIAKTETGDKQAGNEDRYKVDDRKDSRSDHDGCCSVKPSAKQVVENTAKEELLNNWYDTAIRTQSAINSLIPNG
jgi:hypothetical protein